ncbi:hypothetical protein AB1Y20_011477 [Prymnesium parvum]|uniref:Cyclic nucleotide-binding domain-containing protein n=1 Tax=Prymnesium parvum TaxID=97485 RepID=A0AB34IID0_PRYPA
MDSAHPGALPPQPALQRGSSFLPSFLPSSALKHGLPRNSFKLKSRPSSAQPPSCLSRPSSCLARPGFFTRPSSAASLGAPPAAPLADAQQRGADPKQIAAALVARGHAASARGDLRAALALYSRAISLHASEAEYYTTRALLYRKLDRWYEAIADYAQARRLEARGEARGEAWRPAVVTRASSAALGEAEGAPAREVLKALGTRTSLRTAADAAALSAAAGGAAVFAEFDEKERQKLCAVAEGTTLAAGQTVDLRLLKGQACVVCFGRLTAAAAGEGTAHTTLGPSDEFGGSSFLAEPTSSADDCLVADCFTGFLQLSDSLLAEAHANKGAEVVRFVQSVPMLASLPTEKLARLVASLQTRRHKRGEVIFAQGETPQGLCILREGRCAVTRTLTAAPGEREREIRLDTMLPRDTFGGDSVLQGTLRNHASVVAETDVVVLHVPRSEFGANLLSDEALRALQLNNKLSRPSDEVLRNRHETEQAWRRAKQRYIREVLHEAKETKLVKHRLTRNPNMLPSSSFESSSRKTRYKTSAWNNTT